MKKLLLALLSGSLLAAAWPTYGLPLLLFFGFVPLLFIEFQIRTSPLKHKGLKVFAYAYLALFIWNIITTYWIYFSTPVGMIFAILANTLLMSLVFLLYHHVAKRLNSFTAGLVFLAALWMCFEYLHLHWDFSWPWLNLGNGFSEFPQWVQWYEYTGTFGGTLWIWIVNLVVFKAILLYSQHRDKAILYRGILKTTLLIGLPIGISYVLWNSYPSEANQPHLEALVVQPNIDPYNEKYNTDDAYIGRLLLEMTNKLVDDSTAIVIAPETVFADGTKRSDFKLSAAHYYGKRLLIAHPQVSFLAGISQYDIIRNADSVKSQTNFLKPGLWFNDYNSAFLMSHEHPTQFYHKSKLVVGVENFPYQSVLKPILGDIMIDLGGTVAKKTTQPNREVFTFGQEDYKTAPIICYESVYGEFVTGYVQNGAQFLSIITNDAWWGDTQGYKQHLSYARLRAIETRRDVVQSANNGISAFINQKGEIIKRTKYDVRDVIKENVYLNTEKTFYVKHGDFLARIAQFMALFIFLSAFLKKKKSLTLDS